MYFINSSSLSLYLPTHTQANLSVQLLFWFWLGCFNFLLSSWCFQCGNIVDNTLMIQLLQGSAYTKSMTFQFLMAVLPVKKLGECTRSWEGTDDPNWPVGYSIPYDVTVNNKSGGIGRGVYGVCHCSWSGWAKVSSKQTIALCITLFVYF